MAEQIHDNFNSVEEDGFRKHRPTREQAEEAVRVLLRWAGDDPGREGLLDTPKRVVSAYEEFFSGYLEDPKDVLGRTFEDVGGYDDIVLLRDIKIHSHCEHHMVPIVGKAHIAYMPNKKVVGISKLARVLDIFSRRLQTQETMTADIARVIDEAIDPLGVAVMIEAEHYCMTMRGVKKDGVATITTQMLGIFKEPERKKEFMDLVR